MLMRGNLRMCTIIIESVLATNALRVLILLELLKMCKQHTGFSTKCFLRGYKISVT